MASEVSSSCKIFQFKGHLQNCPLRMSLKAVLKDFFRDVLAMQGRLEGKESSKGRRSRRPQCFFLSHVPPHSPTHSYHQEENGSDLETQSHAEEAPCPTGFHVDALTANRGPDHRHKLLFLVPTLALIY